MADEYVSKESCQYLCEDLRKADAHQNEIISRIEERQDKFEVQLRDLTDLIISVKELALKVNNVSDVVSEQNIRLKSLEARDGEKYRDIWKIVVTALVGIGLGALAVLIGVN